MNEIERAIAYWEEFEREIDEMPHSDILEAQREPVKTALTVLRAELSRQENAPLTWNEHINQMTVEEKGGCCRDPVKAMRESVRKRKLSRPNLLAVLH